MIRILIVDDSPTEVSLLRYIIDPEKDMEVIGVARDGKEAIDLTDQLKPDLITMDIQMPVMDGLEATRIIMSQNPTPIIVISSTVSDESIKSTFHILEVGALTALAKPTNILSPSFGETRKKIVDTLRSMAEISVTKMPLKPLVETLQQFQPSTQNRIYEIVAIGASVGGPLALKVVLSKLPADFPIPIVIVQHMSEGFIEGFVHWLAENIALKVKIPEDDEILQGGTVYIAPEKKHLEIERINLRLAAKSKKGELVSSFCPSISVLFNSVAKVCGKGSIAILLTGMSDDGAVGMLEVRKANGHTLIQDSESAIVFGMAGVAQSMGAVEMVVELDNMADHLKQITKTE